MSDKLDRATARERVEEIESNGFKSDEKDRQIGALISGNTVMRQKLAAADALIASQAAEIERLKTSPPSEDYWDQNAVQCGNCSIQLLSRKSTVEENTSGLSDTGGSEDESLCGFCAGNQMYEYCDRLDQVGQISAALDRKLAQQDSAMGQGAQIATLTNARDSWHAAYLDLEAQARSMREALENAPHEDECGSLDWIVDDDEQPACDCWKAAALAQVSESPLAAEIPPEDLGKHLKHGLQQAAQPLFDFVRRHKIAGVLIPSHGDEQDHELQVDVNPLPPRIKCVLREYGSIYVIDEPVSASPKEEPK